MIARSCVCGLSKVVAHAHGNECMHLTVIEPRSGFQVRFYNPLCHALLFLSKKLRVTLNLLKT